jgi:curved DNA-binding protein CbpA
MKSSPLSVSVSNYRTATTIEIKTSYRKLALKLHPDRNDGCDVKTKAFKEASEAYDILIDNNRRREYDMATGWGTPEGWYNKNRCRPPPVNYRKVYAPHAPPDGKWHDAQRHYEMHYGEGMFREAVKTAYEQAKIRGDFDYRSPLGKGFAFDTAADRNSRHAARNPFSKAQQGPPSQAYKYEEGYTDEAKTKLKRKQGVVSKLHERRQERMEKEEADKLKPAFPGQKTYKPLNEQSSESACLIM